jgi:hypothetical protein
VSLLLCLDAGRANDVAPALVVRLDARCEVGGCAAQRHGALATNHAFAWFVASARENAQSNRLISGAGVAVAVGTAKPIQLT